MKSLAKVYFSLAYPYKGALLQHSAPEGSYVDQSERSGYTSSVKLPEPCSNSPGSPTGLESKVLEVIWFARYEETILGKKDQQQKKTV